MNLLAAGAGASAGLEKHLADLLAQAKFEELKRSTLVDEAQRSRALDETTALRRDTMLSNAQGRKDTLESNAALRADANRIAELGRQQVRATNRPIGSVVPSHEHDQDISGGAASEANFGPAKLPTLGMSSIDRGEVGPEPGGYPWKGTQAAITSQQNADTAANKDVNSQQHTYLFQGKPIDALLDPQTKRVWYKGQDVTERVEHYTAPDRTLIQSGSGYIPRPDAARTLAGGGDVPLPTTSSTRTMQEGAKMLEPHIDSLKNQAEALDAAGLFGPVMSRVRAHLTTAGTIDQFISSIDADPELSNDRRAGKFTTSLGLMATGAGRVHGGARGGGSPQMYAHFKAMLSDASSLQMFLGRLDAVDDYMTGYAAGPTGEKPAAGGGAVPKVGETFQGGKVLKITPIP